MTLIDDMEATNDVALAVTSSLEQLLGEDVILAVGVAQRMAPDQDLLPAGATRAVSLPVTDGIDGEIALDRGRPARDHARSRAPTTSCSRRASRPALEAGATVMSGLVADEVHLGPRDRGRDRIAARATTPTSSSTRCSRTTNASRAS